MKKKNSLFGILMAVTLLLMSAFVLANSEHSHQSEIEEGKKLVESKVSCDNLSDEQLEAIGEYFMEQMHPGEAHEMMDKMMGGKVSESLKQMHIQMAKRLYCNENVGGMMDSSGMMGSGGMMGMMPMMMNMIRGGDMMDMMGFSGGMMGSSSSIGGGSWWLWSIVGMLFWIALLVALILLIVWLYKQITRKRTEEDSSLEILKKRYAKGELTKKEFKEMKEELYHER